MACCCGGISCSVCPIPAMQVDVNITVPATDLLITSRGCRCNAELTITESVLLLPSNTFTNAGGRWGYYVHDDKMRIVGVEWPCKKTAYTFQVGISFYFSSVGAINNDCFFYNSSYTYNCANSKSSGTLGSTVVINNDGNSYLTGHPCTNNASGSMCCLRDSKTYDFINQLGANYGTYTVTFL
jgi:hypothetical protein